MNKKIVIVLQMDVPEDCEASIRNSFEQWKQRAAGAYAARVQADEVKVQGD